MSLLHTTPICITYVIYCTLQYTTYYTIHGSSVYLLYTVSPCISYVIIYCPLYVQYIALYWLHLCILLYYTYIPQCILYVEHSVGSSILPSTIDMTLLRIFYYSWIPKYILYVEHSIVFNISRSTLYTIVYTALLLYTSTSVYIVCYKLNTILCPAYYVVHRIHIHTEILHIFFNTQHF